jgi:2-iminobutanoate/2-iminopropanoate deaminase
MVRHIIAGSPIDQAISEMKGNEMPVDRDNIFPPDLPRRIIGGHTVYAPVVTVTPGKLVLLSGMLARDNKGNIVGKGDMGAQIRQVGENIKAALAAAGASLADVVRTQTFTTDIDEFFRHIDVRMEYFGAMPTSTTVQITRLSHPDLMVEVEAMAVIPA